MTLLKVMTVAIVGMLTIVAAKRLIAGMEAAKARVRAADRSRRRAVTRLRQDPRTGVYYPET